MANFRMYDGRYVAAIADYGPFKAGQEYQILSYRPQRFDIVTFVGIKGYLSVKKFAQIMTPLTLAIVDEEIK